MKGWIRSPLRHLRRGSRQIAADIDEELAFHMEMRAGELEAAGRTRESARAEAARKFGDVTVTREACIESDLRTERLLQRREYLEEFVADVRHGVRQLLRNPTFTAAAVATLVVGVAAATTMFSVADHVLLRPLPYASPDEVMVLWETDRATGDDRRGVSPADFLDWKAQSRTFAEMGIAEPFGFDLTGRGPPESVQAWLVGAGYAEALGIRPTLGRLFAQSEYDLGSASGVVMVSHRFWRDRFAADPAIVGTKIEMDGAPVEIVGVLPPGTVLPEPTDFWAPRRMREEDLQDRRSGYMEAVSRLRAGVTLAEASSEMAAIAARLATDYPQSNRNSGVNLVPVKDRIFGPVRPALLVLLAAVTFLLLIACVNVANLLLARGAERSRELAVRSALGASRTRLLRQMCAECALLAAVAGTAGIALAALAVRVLAVAGPPGIPRLQELTLDARVLAFGIAISAVTALLFGAAPATRLSAHASAASMSGARSSGSKAQTRLRRHLLTVEIALTLILLVGAGLLMRSYQRLRANDPGFAVENRAALQLFIWDRNPTVESRLQRTDEFAAALRTLPGVDDVAIGSAVPFHPHRITSRGGLTLVGNPAPRPGEEPRVAATVSSPEYFSVMGIPLVRGRPFAASDRMGAPLVAIINESLARRFFPGQDPVGRRVRFGYMSAPAEREIIGVVADVRPTTLDSDPEPELIIPYGQSGSGSITLVVKTRNATDQMIGEMRQKIWDVDAGQAIYHASTVEQLVAGTLMERRFNLMLLGGFSLAALLLAGLGIFGLMSFMTTSRRQEIGIRLALGAQPRGVVSMIVSEGVMLGLPGVFIGIGTALVLSRFLESMLYDVGAADVRVFAVVTTTMLVAAAVGAYVPARRASRLDPSIAIRAD